jgi:hypothetical protein
MRGLMEYTTVLFESECTPPPKEGKPTMQSGNYSPRFWRAVKILFISFQARHHAISGS